MVNATPRPLYSQERDLVRVVQEADWVLGPVWTGAENLVPSGIRFLDRVVPAVSLYLLRYLHFATVQGVAELLYKLKGVAEGQGGGQFEKCTM